MTRYYFYAADLYYYDPERNSEPARVGDYQGVAHTRISCGAILDARRAL